MQQCSTTFEVFHMILQLEEFVLLNEVFFQYYRTKTKKFRCPNMFPYLCERPAWGDQQGPRPVTSTTTTTTTTTTTVTTTTKEPAQPCTTLTLPARQKCLKKFKMFANFCEIDQVRFPSSGLPRRGQGWEFAHLLIAQSLSRSFCSNQMSTVSDSLRSLKTNERQRK